MPNISMHARKILSEGELDPASTVKNYLTAQTEKTRQVRRNIIYYNLDMILAIGYRVRSERGTQFRIWATQHLSEFLQKGFVLDKQRLKGNDVLIDYFDDLLAQIQISSDDGFFELTDIIITVSCNNCKSGFEASKCR